MMTNRTIDGWNIIVNLNSVANLSAGQAIAS